MHLLAGSSFGSFERELATQFNLLRRATNEHSVIARLTPLFCVYVIIGERASVEDDRHFSGLAGTKDHFENAFNSFVGRGTFAYVSPT